MIQIGDTKLLENIIGNLVNEEALNVVNDVLGQPAAAPYAVDKDIELMLMPLAVHVKSARVQRLLYRLKVAKAVASAKTHHQRCSQIYILCVDYGHSMELPHYAHEYPGCTYSYSLLGVYKLGIMDHTGDYGDGVFDVHLHVQVNHEGIAKKGTNNVASLIMQMMQEKTGCVTTR